MKLKSLLCLLLLIGSSACQHKSPVAREAFLPADFFPITPWELEKRAPAFKDPHIGLTSLAGAGFNTAAFARPDDLPTCRKLGIKAIIRPAPPFEPKWLGLTDQQIDQRVRDLVKGTENDDTVIGYFIQDEPGIREFPTLGKAVAAVKKYAPGKLAYINLYPDYATLGAPNLSQLGTNSYEEYLEQYIRIVNPQFISYDNYRVQSSDDLQKPAVAASYFDNLLMVRKVALKHNLPFWNIASGNQIRKFTPIPSPANLLMQGWTTLAAGAHGLTWFTYYASGYGYAAVDKDGHLTPTWSYLRLVNEQVRVIGPTMRKLKTTGVYFTSPAPVASLPNLPGNLVDSVQSPTPVMVGEFAGPNDSKYIIVVNLSLQQSSKLQIKLRGSSGILQSMSPVDGSFSKIEETNSIWLTAGQGALLKVP